MSTINQELSQLSVSAETDDLSFPTVLAALGRLHVAPPGADETERMLHFVGRMLDHGFVPVSSPYADPPGVPWPEKDKAAILDRLRREWKALKQEITFLDLCWFSRPKRH